MGLVNSSLPLEEEIHAMGGGKEGGREGGGVGISGRNQEGWFRVALFLPPSLLCALSSSLNEACVPLECDINIAVNGPFLIATSTNLHHALEALTS